MSSAPCDVVRAFYDAVDRRDGAAITDLVSHSFREDASVVWPEGLPYGGRVEGAQRLGKLFAGMATRPQPVGPDGLEVVSLVDGGTSVAAQLTFRWHAPGSLGWVRSGALELWTFDDGLVAEIRAYYWDTAACQDLMRNNKAASADALAAKTEEN